MIAFLMDETGECGEEELHHSDGYFDRADLADTIALAPVRSGN
jgi:hypothetical protein